MEKKSEVPSTSWHASQCGELFSISLFSLEHVTFLSSRVKLSKKLLLDSLTLEDWTDR